MIVLSWNCRGLNQPAMVPTLCELIKARKADIVFLSETISVAARLELVRVNLKFRNCFTVDCNGRSGGLCLLWNDKVDFSLLSYSSNHIDMEVTFKNSTTRLTGFYGYPEISRRHLSWDLLRRLSRVNQLPWICIGDFNDLLWSSDKNGKVDHPKALFRGFREATSDSGLIDLPLRGNQYTWSRGRGTDNFVEERLDRAMSNTDWQNKFPNARLLNLVAPVSDHNPILLDTDPTKFVVKKKGFRFENKWLKQVDLPNVVKSCWFGFRDLGVLPRLKATADTLKESGNGVERTFIDTKRALERELILLQSRSDVATADRVTEIRRKLSTLLIDEEIYWNFGSKGRSYSG